MKAMDYERIFTRYIDTVYRVALNGCKNVSDAEDIVQNTFVKLMESSSIFEDDEHIRKWLIRVTVNECKSLWRNPWKKRRVEIENINEPVFSTPERSALYYAVRDLPPKYREVVYLYYFEEFSIKEIADVMGISETAIQTRLQRARQKLKNMLGGYGNEQRNA